MNAELFPGAREPALAALLNALVDRIDAQSFEARSRDIIFRLNPRNWPDFFAIEYPRERAFVWQLLGTLAQQPGFALKLDERRSQRDLDVWDRQPRIIVAAQGESFLRDVTGRHLSDAFRWTEQWRQAVPIRFGQGALTDWLLARPIIITQHMPEEVLERFAAITALSGSNLMLHEVASRQFWGLSKILNAHQKAIALLLGLDTCPFSDKPVQLVVQTLTDDADAPILFIENAATFESLASWRLDEARGFILVYASGYKASARRIRIAEGSSVYFSPRVFEGNAALPWKFLEWLHSPDTARPVYFWGDLDFAGMGILKELRVVFPKVQAWKPGYEELLDRLLAGESHAPDEAKKSGQTDPIQTGCHYADEVLLPALRKHRRFVDQESL